MRTGYPLEPDRHIALRLAVCQAEVYPDDPPAGGPLPNLDALQDLAEVIQGLLDLDTIDDPAGDLSAWSKRWGYPLDFPTRRRECA